MSLARLLVVGLALFLAVDASAQPPKIADLELEVVEPPPPLTPPGSTGTVAFRVTNHGPEIAGESPTGLGVWIASSGSVFREGVGTAVYFFDIEGDCEHILSGVSTPRPGDEPRTELLVRCEALPAGESWTFTLKYRVHDFVEELVAGSQVPVYWVADTSSNSNNEDPNPANDELWLVFPFLAAIPTLGPAGLAALTLGLLLAFVWVRRSRKPLM